MTTAVAHTTHTDDDVAQAAPGEAPRARAGLRAALRPLLVGAIPGALVYIGLFALCLWLHTDTEYMGVANDGIASTLTTLFEDAIIAQQLGFLALYAAIGATLGLAAAGVVDLFRRAARRPYRPTRHLAWTVALVLAFHSWLVIRSAAHYPALYAPQADDSTWLGVLFWLATDVLPRWLIDALAAAALAATLGAACLLAARAARDHARGDGRSVGRLAPAATLIGLLAGAAAAATTGNDPVPAGSRDAARPNVLIIAVDSLRADVLEHDADATPNLRAFAETAAFFPRTWTVLPRTLPAWTTILTGRYPHHHGVRHMFPAPRPGPLADGALPAILAARGYRTRVISDFAGDVFKKGDLGFDHVDAPPFTLASNVALGGLKVHVHLFPWLVDVARGAGTPELMAFERLADPAWLTDKALAWLADDDRPFFLTVFYSAGHFPFAAPAPYATRFTDAAYDGPSRFHKAAYGAHAVDAAEAAHIRGLYRGAIAASDAAIGRLLDDLDAAGLLANTVVVLTADHGETIYEHDLGVGHGDHLYGTESLRVPLVLRWPGMPRRGRFDAPASLLDVAPTILARLGVPEPRALDGVDLGPVVAGKMTIDPARPLFAETGLVMYPPETARLDDKRLVFARGFEVFRFDPGTWDIYLDPAYEPTFIASKHRMMLSGDRKLLYMPTRDGVRFELYDALADPGDRRDLAATEPERLAAMKAALYTWMLEDPALTRAGDFVVPRAALDAGPLSTGFGP